MSKFADIAKKLTKQAPQAGASAEGQTEADRDSSEDSPKAVASPRTRAFANSVLERIAEMKREGTTGGAEKRSGGAGGGGMGTDKSR